MVSIVTTFYIWWTELNLENTSCRKGRKLQNSRTKQIGCLDFRQNRKRLQAGFGSLRNLPVQTLTPFHNTNLHTELQISFDQPNRKWIICAWIIKRHNQGKILQNYIHNKSLKTQCTRKPYNWKRKFILEDNLCRVRRHILGHGEGNGARWQGGAPLFTIRFIPPYGKKKEYLNNFTRRGKKTNILENVAKKEYLLSEALRCKVTCLPNKRRCTNQALRHWSLARECWCKLCRASVLISLSYFRSFLIKPKIALLYIFCLDSRCSVSVILQLVGRPVWVQFIDLFSLFFNSFTFVFQLQYPVGNVVQKVDPWDINLLTYFSISSVNYLSFFVFQLQCLVGNAVGGQTH